MLILCKLMSLDLVMNKTSSQSRLCAIIQQDLEPSLAMQHLHHFFVVCWVRTYTFKEFVIWTAEQKALGV